MGFPNSTFCPCMGRMLGLQVMFLQPGVTVICQFHVVMVIELTLLEGVLFSSSPTQGAIYLS